MSALVASELPEADRAPIAKPDPFAAAMARFRAACPARELSALELGIEAELQRGALER